MAFSLKTELKKRLVVDMITAVKTASASPALTLVVDLHTARVVSSAVRMYDLMETGVVVIQNITLSREPLQLPAIYFIQPTESSITALAADFTAKSHQYDSVYLYFTSRVRPELMQIISSNTALVARIQSFVELNVDWIAAESRLFSFDRADTISSIYFPSSQDVLANELTATAKQLVSLCLTLHEFPLVRYSKLGKSGINRALAQFFEDEMKKSITKLTQWTAAEHRDRGTLLIVDRSIDPAAPLMHDITYQAMANDLLRVKGELCYLPSKQTGRYETNSSTAAAAATAATGAAGEEANCVLSEDDSLWLQLRHQHISTVTKTISAQFRAFRQKNVAAQFQDSNNNAAAAPMSVKDMQKVMADMPEYKQLMQKYSKHFTVAETAFKRFTEKSLVAVAAAEQDIITGYTDSNNSCKLKEARALLVAVCSNSNIGRLEKLRLLLLYVITHGPLTTAAATAADESFRATVLADIPTELHSVFTNITRFGIDTQQQQKDARKATAKAAAAVAGNNSNNNNNNDQLSLQRYTPFLASVMESLALNSLDTQQYPYNSPPPEGLELQSNENTRQRGVSIQQTQGQVQQQRAAIGNYNSNSSSSTAAAAVASGDWKQANAAATAALEVDNRPLLLVYVIGGVACSEIRACYDLSKKLNVNIIIGSTTAITGSSFVRQLAAVTAKQFKQSISGGDSNRGDELEYEPTVMAPLAVEDVRINIQPQQGR